jgi:hypothetical protein
MEQRDILQRQGTCVYPNGLKLNGLDPQFRYGITYNEDLKSRLLYVPTNVDILEIDHYESGEVTVESQSLSQTQLRVWIDEAAKSPAFKKKECVIGGLRLIMGRSISPVPPENVPATFPHGMQDIKSGPPLPFSIFVFNKIVEDFKLAKVTPWVFVTDQSHFVSVKSIEQVSHVMMIM